MSRANYIHIISCCFFLQFIKADALKEAFAELESNNDVVQLTLSPDIPHFRFSVIGGASTFHVGKYPESLFLRGKLAN